MPSIISPCAVSFPVKKIALLFQHDVRMLKYSGSPAWKAGETSFFCSLFNEFSVYWFWSIFVYLNAEEIQLSAYIEDNLIRWGGGNHLEPVESFYLSYIRYMNVIWHLSSYICHTSSTWHEFIFQQNSCCYSFEWMYSIHPSFQYSQWVFIFVVIIFSRVIPC